MSWGPARGLSPAARFLKRAGVPHSTRRQILESFQPDCRVEIIADDLVVFRYYCSTTAARGRWLAERLLADPLEELALPPGNTVEHVATWIIPKGTVVVRGSVAPKPAWGRHGGATQIFVPDPTVLREVV